MQGFKEEGEACVNRVGNDDHLAREVFAHFEKIEERAGR